MQAHRGAICGVAGASEDAPSRVACVLRVVLAGGLAGAPPGLDRATPPQRCCAGPLWRPRRTSAGAAGHGGLLHDHAYLLVFALLSC